MTEKRLEAVIRRVREVLAAGGKVAVMGWRNNNHTAFTRSLSKKVRFFEHENPPKELGPVIRILLHAKYLQHKHVSRVLRPGLEVYSFKRYNSIIEVLELCKDLLQQEPSDESSSESDESEDEPARVQDQFTDDVLDFLTSPRSRGGNHKMHEYTAFAKAFASASAENASSLVSKRVLSQLRQDHGVEASAQKLIGEGWLVPVTAEGKSKAGWYKAGDALLAILHAEKSVPPEDPFRYAEWLVAQKPVVSARREEAQAEYDRRIAEIEAERKAALEKLDATLAEIELAEEAVAQIKALRSR